MYRKETLNSWTLSNFIENAAFWSWRQVTIFFNMMTQWKTTHSTPQIYFPSFVSFNLHPLNPTCVQGLLYHMLVGTQGPPLQAFISAGFSPTQSPPPPPSLIPPWVRHTTSLLCTPGPHCAEHWGTKWKIMLRITVKCCECFFPSLLCVTHSVGPVSEVPVGYTRPHVALFTSLWADPGVALLVVHDVALIADAAHTPRPPPNSTVHWALWQNWEEKNTNKYI